jgi:hypothetical protein
MIRDLNLLLEEEGEEGDQGALPDLNEEIDMEEDGRAVVILGDNLLGVDGQEHGGFLDLNLHPFDLNMEAIEEEQMQQGKISILLEKHWCYGFIKPIRFQ